MRRFYCVKIDILIKYANDKLCCGVTVGKNVKIQCIGNYPKGNDIYISAEGHYSRNGSSVFVIDTYKYLKINEKNAFISYALTFKGIGNITAERIYDNCGINYDAFVDESILSKYVKPQYIDAIIARAKQDNEENNLEYYKFLGEINSLSKTKRKLLLQSVPFDDLKSNPFRLVSNSEIKLSFRTANEIAIKLNCSLHSDERLELGTKRALQMLLSNGHTYVDANRLISKSLQVLNNNIKDEKELVTDVEVKKALNSLNRKHIIKAEKTKTALNIYDIFYYDAENDVAKELKGRIMSHSKAFSQTEICKQINEFEAENKIKLADSQRLAVNTVVNNNICVITGSAGTGKTTVLKACIYALENLYSKKIVLAAPTGRAARRMAEATDRDAKTLHSLLHLGISDGEESDLEIYMSDEKIDADAVFVDETSMCDIGIIYRLFQKLDKKCRVYFIGDPNQLEPVGSGNFLSDVISSCCVPTIKLQFIYRQNKDSNIIINANKILQQNTQLRFGNDFVFYDESDIKKIQDCVADIYYKELKMVGNPYEVQCICPMRVSGYLASNQMNKIIQKKVNPNCNSKNVCMKANGFMFFVGDKVICSKNTETVKNGDIGIVSSVSAESIDIDFETGPETYDIDSVIEYGIILAYSITVHKAQGSEFSSVIIPVADENKNMMKQNLIYTAVTRAKKKMIFVGEIQQLKYAIKNNKKANRNCKLKARIMKCFL